MSKSLSLFPILGQSPVLKVGNNWIYPTYGWLDT